LVPSIIDEITSNLQIWLDVLIEKIVQEVLEEEV
jgi:hypothetical protein